MPGARLGPSGNGGYWGPKLERNVERDRETTALLEAAGWTVLRFWSHEDPAECAAIIARQATDVLSRNRRSVLIELDQEDQKLALDAAKV